MRKLSIPEWTVHLLLTLSTLTNVFLAYKLKVSDDRLIATRTLMPGERVAPIAVKSDAGVPVIMAWRHTAPLTMIYYFSPTCIWCVKNRSALASLVTQLGPKIKVYGYSPTLEGIDAFRPQSGTTVSFVTDDRQDVRRVLKLAGTPQTIILNSEGQVVKNWEGAYLETVKTDIEKYFHIHLAPVATSAIGTDNAASLIIK